MIRVVTDGVARSREEGVEALVRAFEVFWEVTFPEPMRSRWVDNDAAALDAAWTAALAEGPVSDDLGSWRVPCLIFIGATDADFLDQARRAAEEIPKAKLLVLAEADHYSAHVGQDDLVQDALLRLLRATG